MLDVICDDALRIFNKLILVEGLNKIHDISHKQRCDTEHYLKCAIDCFQRDTDYEDLANALFARENIEHRYIVELSSKIGNRTLVTSVFRGLPHIESLFGVGTSLHSMYNRHMNLEANILIRALKYLSGGKIDTHMAAKILFAISVVLIAVSFYILMFTGAPELPSDQAGIKSHVR